jgi:nicotinamide-nucleotide amidase
LPWIAKRLFPLGLRLSAQITVPDGDDIGRALAEGARRADLLFVTGGLGPTTDDVTRELTAQLFGLKLQEDPEVLKHIRQRFEKRGLQTSPRVARQALVPEGAEVLDNQHGTAPGLYFPPVPWEGGQSPHVFLLPGPPRELQPMFEGPVMRILQSILPDTARNEMRVFRMAGMGESQVEERVGERLLEIEGLELGYCARPGEVDVRLIGPQQTLDKASAIIEKELARFISARNDGDLAETVFEQLKAAGLKLATVESCTGGLIADRLTNVPGVSEVYLSGYVTYSNGAKVELGVPVEMIERSGAVSEEVAGMMAISAARASGADLAISTTGIAGPGGGSLDKPVGTMFCSLASGDRVLRREKRFLPMDRAAFKRMASQNALELLRKELTDCRVGGWKDRVVLLQGDITKQQVDGIVNAANEDLQAGSGVCGAIHDAAGPMLSEACEALKGCKTGFVKATPAFRLNALRILHAVAPIWQDGHHGEPEKLRAAYNSCFALGKSENLKILAFPAIGTGAYGYPRMEACEIALEATRNEILSSRQLDEIRFVLFTSEDFELYRNQLDSMSD